MVAIVVIAHAPLAGALVSAAQHVYSRDPCPSSRQLAALDVAPDAEFGAAVAQAQALVRQIDAGQGVLVLTDLVGATPGNIAARMAQPGRVAVIAGVNLSMVLRSLCYGASDLDELVVKALAGGAQGVQQIAPTGAAAPQSARQPPAETA